MSGDVVVCDDDEMIRLVVKVEAMKALE